MTRPGSVAFMPCPGVLELVMGSPGLMAPFSIVTFTGTRPASATGWLPSSFLPVMKPGLVEMTPIAIAQKLAAHAKKTGRTLSQFALAWLWANEIVTSVIAGPRTFEQWRDYVDAVGTKWSDDDEALVDSLVAPGHPSTPGYSDPQYPFFGRIVG